MPLVPSLIGLAKKTRRALKGAVKRRETVHLSPVRRIERVKTPERVCAMTFDDGPMNLPASNDLTGKPLTLVLLETLEAHGAHGTFDIVGDTSGSYPDTAGKHGSALWGGVKYDHYPDIGKDAFGGAAHCPELISRIITGGHEITNHTYTHILFGKKPLVYAGRAYLPNLDEAVSDMRRLHDLLRERFGYEMRFARPPHYVDGIAGGFTSYDALGALGYQYMAASFDGAGWLPCKTYAEEVAATHKPLERLLAADPDALCGQIIFQKDGYNMARRTPVADGLPLQLEALRRHGYRVVTVSELMRFSQFADLSPDSAWFADAVFLLEKGFTVAFRDNTVRLSQPLTNGAAAMIAFGREGAAVRREAIMAGKPFGSLQAGHPYRGACEIAAGRGLLGGDTAWGAPMTQGRLNAFCAALFGRTAVPHTAADRPATHADAIRVFASGMR